MVVALLRLGLGAAFQSRPSPVHLLAVVRSGAAGASIQATGQGVSGEFSPSRADSAALLQSSPVHLEAIAKSDAAWAIIQATGQGVNGESNPSLFGHGINDLKKTIVDGNKWRAREDSYYRTWTSMLEHCYSCKYLEKRPTFKGSSVCPEWLYLSVFRAWMQAHDGYREGLELDKDILVFGNKVYSPQTCLFVSKRENQLLTDQTTTTSQGEWGPGVDFYLSEVKFRAKRTVDRKLKLLGYYDSPDEAGKAYRRAKRDNFLEAIASLPNDSYNQPLKQGLARHADRLSPPPST